MIPLSSRRFFYDLPVAAFLGADVAKLAGFLELLHDAPCRRFGIAPDTGFTVFDLNRTYPIDPAEFLSMGRATPFAGWSVQGRCLLTVMEGRAVWYDKTLLEGEDAE